MSSNKDIALQKCIDYLGTATESIANAQITLPGGTVVGGDIGLKVCEVQTCFANEAVKAQYERESNCKFVNKNLCGDKPIDEAKQCCGNDAKNGTVKIKDRVNTQLDPKFSWQTYRQECQDLRQSEGRPGALWRQCVVVSAMRPMMRIQSSSWNPTGLRGRIASTAVAPLPGWSTRYTKQISFCLRIRIILPAF